MSALTVAREVLEFFNAPETKNTGGISFACVSKGIKLKDVKFRQGHACFGSLLSYNDHPEYLIASLFLNRNFTAEPIKKREKEYVSFIIKRSVFADCFQTKNINSVFEKGVILKTHLPAQFVYSALVSLRYLKEYPDIPMFWSKFRKHVSGEEALILSHLFLPVDRLTYMSNPYWGAMHQWINDTTRFGKREMAAFVNRDLSRLQDFPSFKERSSFKGSTIIWSENQIYDARIQPPAWVEKPGQIKFVGGDKRIRVGTWSSSTYLGYSYNNMAEDSLKMLEANRV